ncbi:MAG: methionine--tRNA ligase [Candidatus Electryonea clarkiae]|nr:methionine--tRNA ligase [Candidatus Electryonea clarkiae]MDP8285707.1 methionine--tRNA ligase [Candidatus Electryonea clarkiae]
MKKEFYLTTPLYYVNDEPHIGHAYTTILADVLTRYHRLFGEDVHFLTGTDEHGQKVADASRELGRSPQEHCDFTSKRYKEVWEKLDISYDDFIRTTEDRHKKVVFDIINNIYDKGDIYQKEYEGWYSVSEERFFTEKDLIDGKDPIGNRPVEKIKETNYFFKMSKYQDWLIEYYEKNHDAVLPEFRLNEVLGFLRQPLGDLCISRPKSRLKWGIPIPWDEDYVIYVWFDALINYYSATISPPEGTSPSWPCNYHLIGKDILTTHAVYWPIMLHAAGFELPKHILAHGWWLAKDDVKMSKTTGNVIKPLDLVEPYGADTFRYVLMREMVIGQDAAFSEKNFIRRVNSDLANDLGNLVNRLTKLLVQYFDGVVPDVPVDDENEIISLAGRTAVEVRKKIESLQMHSTIEEIMQFVRAINRYVTVAEPWKTAKTDLDTAGETLAVALEGIRIATVLLSPVMPSKTLELLRRINAPLNDNIVWQDTAWSDVLSGRTVIHGDAIFPRVTLPKTSEKIEKPAPEKKKPAKTPEDGIITYDQFKQVDLRTATILEAEAVPDTDKLLRLQVDIGSEKRQIVAGIAQHYSPEELIGRTIIVVANLQPAKIRGVKSQGMLLAVQDDKNLRLLTPDDEVKPGRRIS